jgi:hypothetical protein
MSVCALCGVHAVVSGKVQKLHYFTVFYFVTMTIFNNNALLLGRIRGNTIISDKIDGIDCSLYYQNQIKETNYKCKVSSLSSMYLRNIALSLRFDMVSHVSSRLPIQRTKKRIFVRVPRCSRIHSTSRT